MSVHEPVMVAEVLEHLTPSRGGIFVDCTVGLGGHARAILEAGASRLIGLDRDRQALEQARVTLSEFEERAVLVHADYREFDDVLNARGVTQVDGMLADLGVSSLQLDAPGRGFSFRRDEPPSPAISRPARAKERTGARPRAWRCSYSRAHSR